MGTKGRGFTAKQIFIGYGTLKSVNTIATAAGLSGVSFGDQEAHARIAADEVNKRGGLCGRKIVIVFYDFVPPGGPQKAQEACTRWTQDQPVFAAVNIASQADQEDALISCLASRKTPLINMWSGAMHPESSYARYQPYHYAPSGVSLERYVPAWSHNSRRRDTSPAGTMRSGKRGQRPQGSGCSEQAACRGPRTSPSPARHWRGKARPLPPSSRLAAATPVSCLQLSCASSQME